MDLELVGPDDQPRVPDGGYTLVEVVVAVVLVVILVLSAAKVLTTAAGRAALLAQQQTAPLVANQAMEQVKAVTAAATASLPTALVTGRNVDDVTAQWNSASIPALDSAWPVADPGAAPGSAGALLPLRTSTTVGATTYTVSTYLGTCERLRADLTAAACTTLTTGATAAVPAGDVRMVRVVVEVSWTPRAGSGCANQRCTYVMSALVDPTVDLTWNPNTTSTPALVTSTTTSSTTSTTTSSTVGVGS